MKKKKHVAGQDQKEAMTRKRRQKNGGIIQVEEERMEGNPWSITTKIEAQEWNEDKPRASKKRRMVEKETLEETAAKTTEWNCNQNRKNEKGKNARTAKKKESPKRSRSEQRKAAEGKP